MEENQEGEKEKDARNVSAHLCEKLLRETILSRLF